MNQYTDVYFYNYLGVYIRYARQDKNISLRELAKRIGISASYLSDVELGKRSMTNDHTLRLLAKELDLPIHGLFTRAEIVPDEILRAYIQEPLKVYECAIGILNRKPI